MQTGSSMAINLLTITSKNEKMRLHLYKILIAVFLLFQGCQKPEYQNFSSNHTVSAINLKFAGTDRLFQGVIAGDSIFFEVPIYKSGTEELIENDLSAMEIIASLPVGTVINPGLGGIKNMNQPMSINVTAANGESKVYILKVKKTGMDYTKGLLDFSVRKEGQIKFYQPQTAAPYVDGETIYIDVPDTRKDPLDISKLFANLKLEPTCTVTPILNADTPIDFSQPFEIKVKDGRGTIRTHYIAINPVGFEKTRFRELWFRTAAELGLTRTNIKSLAVTANNFFIAEFNDWDANGKLNVFSNTNGQLVKKIDPPTTFSYHVGADKGGNILVNTWNDSGKGFILNRYASPDSGPEQILNQVSWDEPQYIPPYLGVNKFSVAGNVKTGKAYVYTTMQNGNYYTWQFNNGVPLSARPVVTKFDVAKTGGTWDIASVKRAGADANAHTYFSWYNEGATETDGKGSRFEVMDAAGIYYRLNPTNHFYKILAFDAFTVNGDEFVAILTQGLRSNSESKLMVFEITNKSKLGLAPGDSGYVNLKVFESGNLGITTDLSSGDVQVVVDGLQVDIYVAATAISSQAAGNAGVRKYRMEYIIE
jgi:hypothetical protein